VTEFVGLLLAAWDPICALCATWIAYVRIADEIFDPGE
jgi:hypothetical protein